MLGCALETVHHHPPIGGGNGGDGCDGIVAPSTQRLSKSVEHHVQSHTCSNVAPAYHWDPNVKKGLSTVTNGQGGSGGTCRLGSHRCTHLLAW